MGNGGKMKRLLMALGMAIAWAVVGLANQPRTKVILDTDMVEDYDDVGALATLHALADEGKCEILATVSSTRGNQSVAAVEILNAAYGRPDIPVGCAKGIGVVGTTEGPDRMARHGTYAWLAQRYARDVRHFNSDAAPDANVVYRRALAAAPDGSVVICCVGFLTNLRRLLETGPDTASPLNGRELVAKKVRALYTMAGDYPKGREYNIQHDAASAKIVFAQWPTPIYVADFNLGRDVYSGRMAAERQYAYPNPVHDVYGRCLPSRADTHKPGAWDREEGGHCSWDPIAVLAAVTGAETFFAVAKGGYSVADDGSNTWMETLGNGGGALQLDESRGFTRHGLGQILDDLIAREPRAHTCNECL